MNKHSLALLVGAAALSLASCIVDAVPTDSKTEKYLMTEKAPVAGKISQEKSTHQIRYDVICGSQPDDLTKAVLDRYKNSPDRVRNAANGRWGIQKYHLLAGIDDQEGATAVLRELFLRSGQACSDFKPSLADYKARGESKMNSRLSGDWREAYDLFDKAGDIEGQVNALELGVDNLLQFSFASTSRDLAELLTFCKSHNQISCETVIITSFFSRHSRINEAEQVITELGYTLTPYLYETRGDYWMTPDAKDTSPVVNAFEAYQKAGSRPKVQQLLDSIRAKEDSLEFNGFNGNDMRVGADAALFLDEQSTARHYAEMFFIRGYSDIGDEEFLSRAGVQVTTDLFRRKGEHCLSMSAFECAYESFTNAENANGVNRTLRSITSAHKK